MGDAAGHRVGHHGRGDAVGAAQGGVRIGGGRRARLGRAGCAVRAGVGRRFCVGGRGLPRRVAAIAGRVALAVGWLGRAVGPGHADTAAGRLAGVAIAGIAARHGHGLARVAGGRLGWRAGIGRLVHRFRAHIGGQRPHTGHGGGGVQLPGVAQAAARAPGPGRESGPAAGTAGRGRAYIFIAAGLGSTRTPAILL